MHLRWKSPAGVYRQVEGKTATISGNGLYVSVPTRPPQKTSITFKIALPVEVTRVPLELQCEGRVVRWFQSGKGSGIGAVIDDYKLQRAD